MALPKRSQDGVRKINHAGNKRFWSGSEWPVYGKITEYCGILTGIFVGISWPCTQ